MDWDTVLVEHLNKEPVEGETEEEAAKHEENANSGCLLETELSEEDFLKALEDTPLRQDLVVHGADQQKPDARAADMESETDETPEELSDGKVINPSSEESDVARVWSNLSGVSRAERNWASMAA